MATATEATLPATRFLEQPKRMLIDGESRFRPERRPLRSGTDVRPRYGVGIPYQQTSAQRRA